MPTPIITLPIHTIEQACALAGLLRAFIDGQSPDTNDGQDWKPDPDLAGIAALYAHLDAGIAEAGRPRPRPFQVGDRVRIARKVTHDAKGNHCGWFAHMDTLIGSAGAVLGVDKNQGFAASVFVEAGPNSSWFSPEALDLIAPVTP